MTVTITAESKMIGNEKLERIDWNLVTIKDIHKRNGLDVKEVRIANGKRHIVFSDAIYNVITIQDDETGRYLLKHSR